MPAHRNLEPETSRVSRARLRPWHTLEAVAVLEALAATPHGLTPEEAQRRQTEFGANALAGQKGPSAWQVFFRQFRSPLIYVLLIAAGLAFLAGKRFDPYVILGIVVVNAVIGFVQEHQAGRALEALKRMTNPKVTALRGGEPHRLETAELVPGDILLLEAGDHVGADARILSASELKVDESALTGESMPAAKHHRAIADGEAMPLGDRRNLVYMNTTVTHGKGRAVVVATGMATQMGAIAAGIAEAAPKTPLQRRLARFSRQLGAAVLGMVGLVAAVALMRGFAPGEVLLTALSMAVSGIPEGLPIVITVLLAIGVSRMARRKALVRRLPAVEALGAATVICSDKTGTLTRNQMTVQAVYLGSETLAVTGAGYAPAGAILSDGQPIGAGDRRDLYWLAACARLCNDAVVREEDGAWTVLGDPTEGALVVLAEKAGFDEDWERAEELPFSSERKWMATLHRPAGREAVVLVKGALDRVLPMATHAMAPDGEPRPLTEADRAGFERAAEQMAAGALRVLALGMVPHPRAGALCPETLEGRLVMLGLVGLLDPPRAEAIAAIAECQAAGIRVVMITGDHLTTAMAIAARMGILRGEAAERSLTGRALEAMAEPELARRVRETDVFARVDPSHKLRIVQALQGHGQVVAMTGDGVNDAPALHAADIGVAMGLSGTEVAKGASDMVLADDNFATIEAAVEEGRVIGDNVKKVLQYLLATSAGEILTILLAIVLGYPLPLAAVQILWINLVTDGVLDKSLALERGEPDLMKRPPRSPRVPLFTRAMVYRLLAFAAVMAAGTLAVYAWDLARGAPLTHARTMAFTTLVMFQWFSAYTLRSLEHPVWRIGLGSNPWFLLGLSIGVALQMAAIYWGPLAAVFQTVPLAPGELGLCLAVASTILVVSELAKWLVLPRLRRARA